MNRDRIQRNDFRTARRGYDRDDVRAHLRVVAEAVAVEAERLRQEQQRSKALENEVERLKREAEGWGVAGSAAKEIRDIIAAAERSAVIIRQGAEDDAQEMRRREEIHLGEVRKRTEAQAGEHVASVEEATARVLEQVAASGSELDQLLGGLRGEAGRLVDSIRANVESVQAELRQIQGGLSDRPATPRPSAPAPASATVAAPGNDSPAEAESPPAPAVDVVGAEAEPPPAPEVGAEAESPAPEVDVVGEEDEELPAEEAPEEFEVEEQEPATDVEPDVAATTGAEPAAPEQVAGETISAEQGEPPAAAHAPDEQEGTGAERQAIAGSEGARLIALNMALNGTPREETARYLSQNFDIEDQDAVLDEVYSRV